MRRTLRSVTATAVSLLAFIALFSAAFVLAAPSASAQDYGDIVNQLESEGFYIEPGAEGSSSRFADLVSQGDRASDNWYFVSMADAVPDDFADDLFDRIAPRGNVLVYFVDGDGFVNVQLASEESESIENRSLAAFDTDWDQPEDFMSDVISDFESLRSSSASSAGSSSTSTSGGSSGPSSSSGSDFPWLFLAIPAAIGGVWFMMSRGKKNKTTQDTLETAQKLRAELQSELDELANDVLVLSGPTDLSDKPEAVNYYREATDTYLTISDEVPEPEKLATANLKELSDLGVRVSHARWQMDAAEALMNGEPVPEKPKIAPPPAPKAPPRPREEQQRQLPQRQARPRVPYSPSRRRSGGGLLDILIAGAGMMGNRSQGRSMGGMFGSSSRGRTNSRSNSRRTRSTPRSGGGVFGGRSNSRSSNRGSSRSSSRSSSRRSTSRRSSSRKSTSRRRRR